MKKPGKTGRPTRQVLRITVDERLDEELLRVLVARLATGTGSFAVDDIDAWGEERSEYVTAGNWPGAFRVPAGARNIRAAVKQMVGDIDDSKLVGKTKVEVPLKRAFWNALQEGQVFLVGAFRVEKKRRGEPYLVKVAPGRRALLRIDRLSSVKKTISGLYSAALTGTGA